MRCHTVSAEVPGLCSADDLFCECGPETVLVSPSVKQIHSGVSAATVWF